eukprot:13950339-Heterocapsa_arctica.AAC.1
MVRSLGSCGFKTRNTKERDKSGDWERRSLGEEIMEESSRRGTDNTFVAQEALQQLMGGVGDTDCSPAMSN